MVVGSQCYRYMNFTEGVNMTVAQHSCEGVNLTLASVHSWQENQKISSLVMSETFLHGGFVLNSSWVWLDGTGWFYSSWGESQPQPSQGTCIIMIREGVWRAARCSETVTEIICQLEKGIRKIERASLSYFYGSATNHLEVGIWVGWSVSTQISKQAIFV